MERERGTDTERGRQHRKMIEAEKGIVHRDVT